MLNFLLFSDQISGGEPGACELFSTERDYSLSARRNEGCFEKISNYKRKIERFFIQTIATLSNTTWS